MPNRSFLYVTYIRTTPERLWNALTDPDFTRQYWFGSYPECEWKPGSEWSLRFPDGRVADKGEVLEADPPRRLVLRWQNEFRPDLKTEGPSRCTFEIEPDGETVKLSVLHETEQPSKLIDAVSWGWPLVLSSLKTLLETGAALPRTNQVPPE